MNPAQLHARASTGRAGLPEPCGPLSALITSALADPHAGSPEAEEVNRLVATVADPLGDDDLHLALYTCYELHYRSFEGVDDTHEWDPALLACRIAMEEAFLGALKAAVGEFPVPEPAQIGEALFELEKHDDGPSLSRYIETQADAEQFCEFVIHRSLYQLKEADPHSWAIPRLAGGPKCALLEVQSDEYGGGRPERIHARLFANTMDALGLDRRENAYLDHVPGTTLATVNLMSAFGLRRSLRGAIVGHLAMFEMTSSLPNGRYANGLRRLGFGEAATDFYDEHVEADAVHENIAAYDLAGGLARDEPGLARDIMFGARALLLIEARFGHALLDAWKASSSSLRTSL
ncbi:MAG TPA: iron-containing redox enzyme family protein [Baekduia sp.]|nr:iron-containing redox enzyme family protein [Baekduia sp.]